MLEVEYQHLSPTESSQGRIAMTPDILGIQWQSMTMYPAGYHTRRIPIQTTLTLPAGWQYGTALETASRQGDEVKFKPTDLETFIDSPLFAGRHFKQIDLDPGAKLPVRLNIVADTPDHAIQAAKELAAETGTKWFVIKSQIHAGGRGKGTVKETGSKGVVLAKSAAEVPEKVKAILGGTLVTHQTGPEGKKVNKVLIAEDVYYPGASEPKEYYMSILLDRSKACPVIMASTEGGMNIEEVAENTPEKIVKEWIDPTIGRQPFQARKIAYGLGHGGVTFPEGCARKIATGVVGDQPATRYDLGAERREVVAQPSRQKVPELVLVGRRS